MDSLSEYILPIRLMMHFLILYFSPVVSQVGNLIFRDGHSTHLSLKDYVNFYLQDRNGGLYCLFLTVVYNVLHNGGRLAQQYFVDQYARIDQGRLNYIKTHQKEIRSDLYQGLEDHVNAGDGEKIGRKTVLPSSYIGGPRYMSGLYQDAMAAVRKYGKPDLFITITCNPKWPEITAELKPHQKAEDRPDIVVRVFRIKLNSLINELKKGIFVLN